MKRLFACLVLLSLLLAACGETAAPTLAGVWVNAGRYSEGRDFVETMTLLEDGTAAVHLEYQGADYATLEGRWTAADGSLSVDFTDPQVRDRVYSYTLEDERLILSGDGKTVEYVRSGS